MYVTNQFIIKIDLQVWNSWEEACAYKQLILEINSYLCVRRSAFAAYNSKVRIVVQSML